MAEPRFAEAEHPRHGDGTFAAKARPAPNAAGAASLRAVAVGVSARPKVDWGDGVVNYTDPATGRQLGQLGIHRVGAGRTRIEMYGPAGEWRDSVVVRDDQVTAFAADYDPRR